MALLSVSPLIAVATLLLSAGSGGPKRAIAVGTALVFGGALLAPASVPLTMIAWKNSHWSLARRTELKTAPFAAAAINVA